VLKLFTRIISGFASGAAEIRLLFAFGSNPKPRKPLPDRGHLNGLAFEIPPRQGLT
jgi:hypothetical protein